MYDFHITYQPLIKRGNGIVIHGRVSLLMGNHRMKWVINRLTGKPRYLLPAATCGHLLRQPSVATYGHLRPLAPTAPCSPLRPLAATCSDSPLWPLAATCGYLLLQPPAGTCGHLRPLEWLQVAASGCVFEIQIVRVCNLNG